MKASTGAYIALAWLVLVSTLACSGRGGASPDESAAAGDDGASGADAALGADAGAGAEARSGAEAGASAVAASKVNPSPAVADLENYQWFAQNDGQRLVITRLDAEREVHSWPVWQRDPSAAWPESVLNLSWSTDGRHLAFVVRSQATDPALFVAHMTEAEPEVERIPAPRVALSTQWLFWAGHTLVVHSSAGGFQDYWGWDLYQGGELEHLGPTQRGSRSEWSPAGLLFRTGVEGAETLRFAGESQPVMELGADPLRRSDLAATTLALHWSRDGRAMTWVSQAVAGEQVEGADPPRRLDTPGPDLRTEEPVIGHVHLPHGRLGFGVPGSRGVGPFVLSPSGQEGLVGVEDAPGSVPRLYRVDPSQDPTARVFADGLPVSGRVTYGYLNESDIFYGQETGELDAAGNRLHQLVIEQQGRVRKAEAVSTAVTVFYADERSLLARGLVPDELRAIALLNLEDPALTVHPLELSIRGDLAVVPCGQQDPWFSRIKPACSGLLLGEGSPSPAGASRIGANRAHLLVPGEVPRIHPIDGHSYAWLPGGKELVVHRAVKGTFLLRGQDLKQETRLSSQEGPILMPWRWEGE